MTSEFVVTAAPELYKSALKELRQVNRNLEKLCDFKDGIFLVETDMPAADFTEGLLRIDPIFVKHVMSVQAKVALTGQKAVDLPVILASVRQVCEIAAGEEFSVQCRCIGASYEYNAKDVEVFVGSSFEAQGAVPTFSDLEQ